MLKLHLAPLAKRDVSEIAEYIAKDDFDAANNWLLNLGLEFKKIKRSSPNRSF